MDEAPGRPTGAAVLRAEPDGRGLVARLRCAWRLARALRPRPDPDETEVRWPDPGPVPVIRADHGEAIRAARLALALTGSPARLVGVWAREDPPWDPRPWRRCDLVAAAGPRAARSLREAGVDVRRIRLVDPSQPSLPSEASLLERVARAPAERIRRVDWGLR